MPKGGARVGAGRKPKDAAAVVQMPGTAPATVVAALPMHLFEPPEDVTTDEDRTWRAYAPAAVANGTLTDATAPGFRYLCELTVRYRALAAVIDAEGWQCEKLSVAIGESGQGVEHVEKKAHPLWGRLVAFALRREQALRAYGLIANGKPVPTQAKADAGDPWAARARKQA